jgi:MbtH protein
LNYVDDDEDRIYDVVVNDEERHSIWRADQDPPAGWYRVGFSGTQQGCMEHIDEVWTDMRPKSLRESMKLAGFGAAEAGDER